LTEFVVDANVAIKWVVPEIHSEAATKALGNGLKEVSQNRATFYLREKHQQEKPV